MPLYLLDSEDNMCRMPDICGVPILRYQAAKTLSLDDLKMYINSLGQVWGEEPIRYFHGYNLMEPLIRHCDRKELLLNCMYCYKPKKGNARSSPY